MKSLLLFVSIIVCAFLPTIQARLLPSPSPPSVSSNLDWPTNQPLQSPALLRALLRARAGPNAPQTNWRLPSKKEDLPPQLDSNSIERSIDDSIQVIPFTRVRGQTSFDSIPSAVANAKFDEGVGPAPSFPAPTASSVATPIQPASSVSSVIEDDEDDLLMSDNSPAASAALPAVVLPPSNNNKEQFQSSARSSASVQPSVQFSELHPVYIKPPEDFKPVLYAHRRTDGTLAGNRASVSIAQPVSNQGGLPYGYPNGVSSWILGGFRGIQRGGYWERLGSDQALSSESASKPQQPLEQPSRNWLLTPAAQAVWYVQTVRDQKQQQTSLNKNENPKSANNPSLVEKVDFVPLDANVASDKDIYDASPSTVRETFIRPPKGQNKFVKESDQDLMMSASQQRPQASKRS